MRRSTPGWWSWEPRALILHPPLTVSMWLFHLSVCLPVRREDWTGWSIRDLQILEDSFYVLSTYSWGQIWLPLRLMLAPCSLRQRGLLEPDHSEKQTNKQLSWNNPDCLVKPACCVCSVASVMSDSFWPYELKVTRLLCPWDSSGKNTGVGCQALLQGIFLTQGSKPCLLHCKWILYRWTTGEAPG